MVAILRARSARSTHAWGASVRPLNAGMGITSSTVRTGWPANSLRSILDILGDSSPLRSDSRAYGAVGAALVAALSQAPTRGAPTIGSSSLPGYQTAPGRAPRSG